MDWSVHLPDVTDGQRDQIAHTAPHRTPAFQSHVRNGVVSAAR
jgi:hypothetical protein